MATFDYRAKDRGGEIVSGTLEAASEDVLVSKLKDDNVVR